MNKKMLSIGLSILFITALVVGCGKKQEDVKSTAEDTVFEEVEAQIDTSAKEATVLPEKDADNEAPDMADKNTSIEIVYHYLSCKEGDKELATGKYPELVIADEFNRKYPKLCDSLERQNESWKETVISDVKSYGYYKQEYDYGIEEPYTSEISAGIVRADDRLFTIIESFYEYSGGAHPNHGTGYSNYDPATGDIVPLKDVITIAPGEEQSKMFWQRLYDTYPDMVDEFKSYDFGYDVETGEEVDTFAQKLEKDLFSWAVLNDGLWIYFSPYEVASYAAGYLEMNFPVSDYPDLVQPIFMTDQEFNEETFVQYSDSETVIEVAPEEPVYDGPISIENPTWKRFSDNSFKKENPGYVTIEKIKEDKSDWLDLDTWYANNNIAKPQFPYQDSKYLYSPCSPVYYDYMYSGLEIMDVATSETLYNFDLNILANGPDNEAGKYSAETQYIRWALIRDNMLYVELSIGGYASEEPDSSYIVGIDLDSSQVVFRTEPQTANGDTFVIVNDVIICGYGFTAEPDYIYILDRFTGERIEQIPVNSAPSHFELIDDTLYVACYNTAYEFSIINK